MPPRLKYGQRQNTPESWNGRFTSWQGCGPNPYRTPAHRSKSTVRDFEKEVQKKNTHDFSPLESMRADFRTTLLLDVAAMADSLDPGMREVGRTMLGLRSRTFDGETERWIHLAGNSIDGDRVAAYRFAKEISDYTGYSKKLREIAKNLAVLERAYTICVYAENPNKVPDKDILLDALRNIEPDTARMVKPEIEHIALYSPYQNVQDAAKRILAKIPK